MGGIEWMGIGLLHRSWRSGVITASPSGFWEVVVVILSIFILTVTCVTLACQWWLGPTTDCPLAFKTGGLMGSVFTSLVCEHGCILCRSDIHGCGHCHCLSPWAYCSQSCHGGCICNHGHGWRKKDTLDLRASTVAVATSAGNDSSPLAFLFVSMAHLWT